MANLGFIAVHVGAGFHGKASEFKYKLACGNSCLAAINILNGGGSAIDACVEAIRVLENDPITNAGRGSSLNRDGFVECDAAIMDGAQNAFGAVGAVPSVENPILVARHLLKAQQQPDSHLVPPLYLFPPTGSFTGSFLVGSGAKEYAYEHQIPVFTDAELPCAGPLVTEDAIDRFKHHKQRLLDDKFTSLTEITPVQDTVGAVCIDQWGNVSAGVSSGGVSLKTPGRVGDSAIFGCGCWAQQTSNFKFACSTTGTGEQLIMSRFASSLGNRVLQCKDCDWPHAISTFMHDFSQQSWGREAAAGFVAICQSGNNPLELFYAHTTHSLGIGFMKCDDLKPKTLVSRKADCVSFRLGCESI